MGYVLSSLTLNGFVLYNRSVAKAYGTNAAIVLGQLCRLAEAFKNGFYFQQEKLGDEIALSAYEVRCAVKKLVDAGFVKVELVGLPAKNRYTILEDAVRDFLELSSQNFSQLEAEEFDTKTSSDIPSNNIYNKGVKRVRDKIPKKRYGSFKNILLSDEELDKLSKNPDIRDVDDWIEKASGYIEAKGDKYKSHYAMILNWVRMDKERNKPVKVVERERRYDHDDRY